MWLYPEPSIFDILQSPGFTCVLWRNFIEKYMYRSPAYKYLLIHFVFLTHRGQVTHKCVNKLTIVGSGNGLSPRRRQAIIKTNAGILLIGPLETNFSEILIEIHTFSFKKMHLKMSSAKWRRFCIGLIVLTLLHPGM